MGKKAKEKIDGLSPDDIAKIRIAIRQVWSWSHPRRLVTKRATHEDGFYRCENKECELRGEPVPKVYIDHITPVGEVDAGFIERLFCPSTELQALCKRCHDAKTKGERKTKKKKEPQPLGDAQSARVLKWIDRQ